MSTPPREVDDGERAATLASLQATAVGRRGGFWMRIGIGVFGAIALGLLTTLPIAGVWFAAMALTQVAARLAFLRFEKLDDLRPPSGPERLACHLVMTASSLAYSAMAVPLWLLGGTAGEAFAVMWLCGALVHTTLHTQHDRALMMTTFAGHMAVFVALPVCGLLLADARFSLLGAAVMFAGVALYGGHLVSAVRRNAAVRARLRAAGERAAQSQAEAEAENKSKSRFLAMMSHELRTPMNGVLGMTRLLLESELSARQRQQTEALLDAGEMMLTIVNDIIDYSKIEGGEIVLEAADVDVRRLVSSLEAVWRPRAEEKGLVLDALVAPDAPAIVRADAHRLRQIVSNLLSQAVRVTDRGEVRLDVAAPRGERDKALLRFSVVDSGPGAPADQIERLFDAHDLPGETAGGPRGAAPLGLAIARQLARLMGGDVLAMSEVGVGARFMFEVELAVVDWTVRVPVEEEAAESGGFELDDPDIEFEDVTGYEPLDLPAYEPTRARVARAVEASAAAPSDAPAPAPAPVAPAPARRLQVCVVEDQALNRRVIEAALMRLDCDITFAVDGADALLRLEERRFDLIFMDLQMPVYDGYEVTRRLRASGGLNAAAPVIGLTANVLPGVKESCLAAGMDDFVSKPVDLRLLFQAVSRALEGRDAPTAERKRA